MSLNEIHQHLNSIFPITDEAWIDFEKLLLENTLERNAYLLKEGENAFQCYLLVNGVIRVFYSNEGSEYNKTFFTKGMFPTPITALVSGQPSYLSFQALTDCSLIQFSYEKFTDLFKQHRCLESLMLRIMEREWIKKERHDIQMVTNDATTNYLIFREEYPSLENLIPQYHIASYLGITPIQLSRIRAQLVKQN